ncbi:hypothetical protein FB558_6365 [Pseudonocardia kunmingensis]|uniref:Uncharacterized protein n=1 Tax=Pseudonocardia kunmingensis TaxID=630975 RepID=A0A543D9V6_9PSEU|nr:hypothetical protein FB558_6365 [Pseudonocardia kunmingensis]
MEIDHVASKPGPGERRRPADRGQTAIARGRTIPGVGLSNLVVPLGQSLLGFTADLWPRALRRCSTFTRSRRRHPSDLLVTTPWLVGWLVGSGTGATARTRRCERRAGDRGACRRSRLLPFTLAELGATSPAVGGEERAAGAVGWRPAQRGDRGGVALGEEGLPSGGAGAGEVPAGDGVAGVAGHPPPAGLEREAGDGGGEPAHAEVAAAGDLPAVQGGVLAAADDPAPVGGDGEACDRARGGKVLDHAVGGRFQDRDALVGGRADPAAVAAQEREPGDGSRERIVRPAPGLP